VKPNGPAPGVEYELRFPAQLAVEGCAEFPWPGLVGQLAGRLKRWAIGVAAAHHPEN